MSLFSSFALAAGALLVLLAVISAWVFRTSAAPLWAKIAVPTLTVAVACVAPLTVASLMGFPVSVDFADLPDRADLIAFVPHDDSHRVDLWLVVLPADTPRAYETALNTDMKKVLREAGQAMARGGRAVLTKTPGAKKEGGKTAGDPLGIGGDDSHYVLDPNALSNLPPKE